MEENKYQKRYLTIPNLMTLFRILLIPVFIILWLRMDEIPGGRFYPLILMALSALSDILDGPVARKLSQVSDLGKALDPVADKLSQMAFFLCLAFRYPVFYILLIAIIVKEAVTAAMGMIAIKKTGIVKGAVWHGKLTTCFIMVNSFFHLIAVMVPFTVPAWLSYVLSGLCLAMMLYSFLAYNLDYLRMIKNAEKEKT